MSNSDTLIALERIKLADDKITEEKEYKKYIIIFNLIQIKNN